MTVEPVEAEIVTFLFTDIEGSTQWWEEHEADMGAALRLHDDIVRSAISTHGGDVFATGGDGFAAAFSSPEDALTAAIRAQEALASAPWASTVELRVRMGIHTGPAEARGDDYFGATLNRAARLMDLGHGGQVLVSEDTKALLPSDVAALTDLGRHRLKDVAGTHRIHQVGEEPFGPLRSLRAVVGNLPRERASFIGRERLVGEVGNALTSSPLVTLTGVGGVGKTRLAVHVAAGLADEFADGTWLCPLADAPHGDSVVDVVNAALGVRPDAGVSAREALLGFLERRHTLLVVDNCEHVIDAAADLVEEILDRAPQVQVLATSREGLAMAGERLLAVSSLDIPRDHQERGEAVALFEARAREVRPEFDLAERVDTATEICRRLDGIPLAIELAAARLATMSAEDLLANLDERFELLTGGRGRGRERHQTLRHVVSWSYDLLDDTERAVFRRLSVFASSFDLDGAVAVGAGFDMARLDVVDTLSSLCTKSLIQVEGEGTRARYRYLETVRAYAEELNEESGDLDAAMAALTEWAISWIEGQAGPLLRCGANEFVAAIDLEEANLRRVLAWAIEHGDAAAACAFFAPLGKVFSTGGDRVAVWAGECADRLDFSDAPGSDALFGLAVLASYEALDLERCVALSDRAADVAAGHGEPALLSQFLRFIADWLLAMDFDAALTRLEAGLDDARASGDPYAETVYLLGRQLYRGIMGDADGAARDCEEILQRSRALDAPTYEMVATLYQGMAAKSDDLDQARDHLLRAADMDGPSQTFTGNLIRQEIASLAVLLDDDVEATRRGAELARYAISGTHKNFFNISIVLLVGPLVRAGDPEFAAELCGWAVKTGVIATFWARETEHVTERVRQALSPQAFDTHIAVGEQADYDDISARLLDRLATLEALVDA